MAALRPILILKTWCLIGAPIIYSPKYVMDLHLPSREIPKNDYDRPHFSMKLPYPNFLYFLIESLFVSGILSEMKRLNAVVLPS